VAVAVAEELSLLESRAFHIYLMANDDR
jgi:hypothetical protein